jgi:outer membrane usher protein
MSIFATEFHDFDDKKSTGVFAGIAIPLGSSVTGFAGVTQDSSGTSVTADLQKSISIEPGSYGGRLSISQGKNQFVSGYGAFRTQAGILEGSLTQHNSAVDGFASFSGALVAAGGGLFVAQRIDDSFAVVDARAPGVKVLLENHPVGITDSSGELLVTGLRSYQRNKISIDVLDLPIDDEVPNTVLEVVPAERSGAIAAFAIEQSAPSAEVVFTDANGSLVEAGTHGTLMGPDQDFVVGYDGRTFIKNLKPQNTVTIDLPSGRCQAIFEFVQKANTLVVIGPISCH